MDLEKLPCPAGQVPGSAAPSLQEQEWSDEPTTSLVFRLLFLGALADVGGGGHHGLHLLGRFLGLLLRRMSDRGPAQILAFRIANVEAEFTVPALDQLDRALGWLLRLGMD